MKLGFYISMGVAIAGLAVGFLLLNDIQQEREQETIWIQKFPTQCNDVWSEEYEEFYTINPNLIEETEEEKKMNYEIIIKNHYSRQGVNILNLELEIDAYEGIRCEACDCLGWDRLSIQIPKDQLEFIPKSEGWQIGKK